MSNLLLPFSELQNPNCPCIGLLDPEDIACFALGGGRSKYQFLDESSPFVAQALADCEGLGFGTVVARPMRLAHNMPDFIPVVTHSSQKLFENFTPPYVGVMIDEVVSNELVVNPNIRKHMGIPPNSKITLLCYGLDKLIENIWPSHRHVLQQLLRSDIDFITSINYSIWHNQPHLERAINVKRSLIVYQTLQDLGFEAIPHIYWSGDADLRRWAVWLNGNPCVSAAAIDLQTIKGKDQALWIKSMAELTVFSSQLARPIRFVVSGPQTPQRIRDIINALGTSVTLTNGNAAISAWNRRSLNATHYGLRSELLQDAHVSDLFAGNYRIFTELVKDETQLRLTEIFLRNKALHNPAINSFRARTKGREVAKVRTKDISEIR
jgi:hypothetical protein